MCEILKIGYDIPNNGYAKQAMLLIFFLSFLFLNLSFELV